MATKPIAFRKEGCGLDLLALEFADVKFRVLIEQDEDGVFVATCPSLPGCVSQGKSREEARRNIQDAVEGYIASLKRHGEPVPPPIDEDTVEVAS